jgi:hypothetical protein
MRSLRFIWSLLWRAQVAHVFVFVLAPLLAAIVHAAVGIVMLPFLLLGAGDRSNDLGVQAQHLFEPGCWVMLAACTASNWALVELPLAQTQPNDVPFLPVPSYLGLRHVWFLVWLVWLVAFLVRRERKRDEA